MCLRRFGMKLIKHVEVHYMSSPEWDGFAQHMFTRIFLFLMAWFAQYIFSCILCPCLHGRGLENTCWESFCVLTRQVQNLCARRHRSFFDYTSCDTFCVLVGMGLGWSTHIEVQFVSRFLELGLVKASWYAFCMLSGMGFIWSTYFEINSVSSHAWEFCEHMCCVFVLSGLGCFGWVWSTDVDMHILSSLA